MSHRKSSDQVQGTLDKEPILSEIVLQHDHQLQQGRLYNSNGTLSLKSLMTRGRGALGVQNRVT